LETSLTASLSKAESRKNTRKLLSRQKYLHIMAVPGIMWMIVFCYLPMIGLVMAFQQYNLIKGIFASPFVGFIQFKELFTDDVFWTALRNSIGMSLVKIAFSFPAPIIFAIALNEISGLKFKRVVQTASYLPHFISWVVIAGIFLMWLDARGAINQILISAHIISEPVNFLMKRGSFWILMAIIDTWKETGWWAIIYLAAISGISLEMFEAAVVDGASRLQQIFYIIIPCLKNTIAIVLILTAGSLIYGGLSGSNFNQSLLFGNVLNYDSSEILDTYVLRLGLENGRFSFATAAGLIQSIISLVLFSWANWSSRRLNNTSLY
jgi:putative aldouronate transport system permease protein